MTEWEAARLDCQCCIAGGGPAGMMLGLLLARAGVRVIVLEKHADFLRDFRGDTIHPSTLEVMHELGLLDALLERPHQKLARIEVLVGGRSITAADFSHLPTLCPFIAFMPQWDFLDFLASEGMKHENFELRMRAEVVGLVREEDRVVGLRAMTPAGPLEVRASLVVGADGRHSAVRREANLPRVDLGAPMDVLWMSIPKSASDPRQTLGRVEAGKIFLMIDRGEYWQCAYVIPKGSWDEMRNGPIQGLRDQIVEITPFLSDRLHTLEDWDDVRLLTVRVDRLTRWHSPGVLCIGDAAHAMSPIGGVGINLAIQDGVAAANLLARPLTNGSLSDDDSARVQRRRELPTRITQRVQLLAQRFIIQRVLARQAAEALRPPAVLRLLEWVPALTRLTGRAVGIGFRPEHVDRRWTGQFPRDHT